MTTKPTPSLKLILSLTSLAFLSAVLLQSVVNFTKPIIEENRAQYLKEAIFEVLPDTKALVAYQIVGGKLVPTEQSQPDCFAALDKDNNPTSYLFQAQAQGYQELIKILFAYDPKSKQILGIKVLESKETPGLGDKIITDLGFLSQFQGLPVNINQPLSLTPRGKAKEPWNIDSITGATISSRAVVRILNQGGSHFFPKLHSALESEDGK